MRIFAVESKDIDRIWPEVLPTLKKVEKYNYGSYTMGEVKESLKNQESLLICVKDEGELLATITCTEEPHPTRKVLHMPIVCGRRMDEWLDLCHDIIPRLAKERGYDLLITKGRKGWGRVLKKYGFRERFVSYGLDL